MRKTYLLAYSDDVGTRDQLKNALNEMPSVITWRYDMTNAFYIISEEMADTISTELRDRLPNGRFLVTELGDNRQGWLTKDSWHLIRNKQHRPKE